MSIDRSLDPFEVARHPRRSAASTSSPAPTPIVTRDRHREALRRPPRAQGLHDDGLSRRDGHDPRPFGEWQEHVPALPELPRGADRRRRSTSAAGAWWPIAAQPLKRRDRAGVGRDPPAPAARRDGVPGVQPVPASVRARQPHRGAHPRQEDGPQGGHRAGRGEPREGRPQREARRVPVTPVGRPAPARGDRPGAHDGARRAPVRRAHERARPVARRRGAQGHGETWRTKAGR